VVARVHPLERMLPVFFHLLLAQEFKEKRATMITFLVLTIVVVVFGDEYVDW
jgi:hypothetical protein